MSQGRNQVEVVSTNGFRSAGEAGRVGSAQLLFAADGMGEATSGGGEWEGREGGGSAV